MQPFFPESQRDLIKSENILIVEDNRAMAMAEAFQLWNAGYHVEIASTGTEALHSISKTTPNLTLLDFNLPDMNGLEVLNAVFKEIPDALVVMVTGKGDENLAVEVIKKGAKDYLVKNDTLLESLINVVTRVLEEEKIRKVLEEKTNALKRSQETAKVLLNASHDAAVLVNKNLIILFQNKAGKRLFNTKIDKPATRMVPGFSTKDWPIDGKANIEEVIAKGEPIHFDSIRKKRRLNTTIWPIVDENGQTSMISVFSRDVTKQWQAEKKLHKVNETLEKRVKERTAKLEIINKKLRSEIKERKQVEKDLISNKQLLQTVFDTLPHFLVVKNKAGKYLMVNNAWREIFDLSPSEVINKNIMNLQSRPKTERNRILKEDDLILSGKNPFSDIEATYTTCKGEKRIYQVVRSPLINDNKAVTGLVTFGIDITEREKAVKELIESEERSRIITDSAYDAIVMVDDQGIVTFWNPAAENIFGYGAEEIVGNKMDEYIIPERFHQNHNAGIKRFLEKGGISALKPFETLGIRKNGEEFPMEVMLSSIRLKNDLLSISFIKDLTDRKKTEEERDRLAAAVKNAAEIILVTGTDEKIQYINPVFEQYGYDQKEILGKDPSLFIDSTQGKIGFSEVIEKARLDQVWKGHLTFRKKEGKRFCVDATVSPIKNDSGEIKGYVTVARNIDREIQLEHQLHHALKMEAIGILAGGIAHDFNNILTPILGYTDIARNTLPKESKVQRDLEAVLRAANRAKDLVAQILQFSRQTAGESRPILLDSLLKEIVKLLRSALPKSITINEYISPDLRMISSSPVQMHSLIMNLCTNAIQAMPSGGELKIGLDNINLKNYEISSGKTISGEYICLVIEDNGFGMDQETLDRIFEPFFTTKDIGEGTGLGLSTVYGIVDQNHGHISVTSKVNAGSTFKVLLPAVQNISTPDRTIEDKPPAKGVERILFIDDEVEIVEMVKVGLEPLGYKITGITQAKTALNLFQNSPEDFDLIITDQMMPGMIGEALAQNIRKIRKDIPIIICTGDYQSLSPQKLKKLAINKILTKPYSSEILSKSIRHALDFREK